MGQVERKERRRERGGVDLPQAEVAVLRRLGRDDTRAQQHWPDRVHPHRGRVQDQHMLNTSVGHDQLADGHAETLDEEQDVLVHLRVAVWGRMGWRASCRLGGQCVPARMRRVASGVERTTPKGTAPWSSVKKNEGVGGISQESGT